MSGIIRSLGYLRIESADSAAWREFGVRVLGMAEGRGPDAGAVYLRMDDFPARLVIVPGERDRLLASGWEVAGEDGAGRGRAGRWTRPASRSRRAPPRSSPSAGWRRCCASTTRRATRWRCSAAPRSSTARRSARTGTGSSPACSGWATWCCRCPTTRPRWASTPTCSASGCGTRCGWRRSCSAARAGPPLWMRFLGCNPRHHSLALAPFPAPAGIVHLMIEVASLDDVGRAMDRCARRGGAGQRQPRAARQRPDGVVLRADAGRVRHRVRHRRPARRRRDLGEPGDHRDQPVGAQLRLAGAR